MPELSFNEIVKALDGSPENAVPKASFTGFHFDTRLMKGENRCIQIFTMMKLTI